MQRYRISAPVRDYSFALVPCYFVRLDEESSDPSLDRRVIMDAGFSSCTHSNMRIPSCSGWLFYVHWYISSLLTYESRVSTSKHSDILKPFLYNLFASRLVLTHSQLWYGKGWRYPQTAHLSCLYPTGLCFASRIDASAYTSFQRDIPEVQGSNEYWAIAVSCTMSLFFWKLDRHLYLRTVLSDRERVVGSLIVFLSHLLLLLVAVDHFNQPQQAPLR